MKTFSIVFSNYTGCLFAWEGPASSQKKFLGNRQVIGEIEAPDSASAVNMWKQRSL